MHEHSRYSEHGTDLRTSSRLLRVVPKDSRSGGVSTVTRVCLRGEEEEVALCVCVCACVAAVAAAAVMSTRRRCRATDDDDGVESAMGQSSSRGYSSVFGSGCGSACGSA